jgi:hypothetical protein
VRGCPCGVPAEWGGPRASPVSLSSHPERLCSIPIVVSLQLFIYVSSLDGSHSTTAPCLRGPLHPGQFVSMLSDIRVADDLESRSDCLTWNGKKLRLTAGSLFTYPIFASSLQSQLNFSIQQVRRRVWKSSRITKRKREMFPDRTSH